MQIKKTYPNAEIKGLRGNVNTRLQKLRDGEYDGIILAHAGLNRMGLMNNEAYEYHIFSTEEFIPAGGQGILAVEGRKDDEISDLARKISDKGTEICYKAERRVLELLNAGCNEPYGVYATIEGEMLQIRLLTELAGNLCVSAISGEIEQAEELARKLVTG